MRKPLERRAMKKKRERKGLEKKNLSRFKYECKRLEWRGRTKCGRLRTKEEKVRESGGRKRKNEKGRERNGEQEKKDV